MADMPLPLPSTIKASQVLHKQNEYLLNSFSFGYGALSRPGTALVHPLDGKPRGLFEYNGVIYAVQGSRVYGIKDGGVSDLGLIYGLEHIRVAKGFAHVAICSPNSSNYVINKISGELRQITATYLPPCIDVERVDGYFIWVPANGETVIFSALNDAADVDPLDFFDAESLPDENRGVIVYRNDLFVLGAESIERFRNVGSVDAPFIRVTGGVIRLGYIGGKISGHETFMWLGQESTTGIGFFAYTQGTGQRISTPAIDEILQHDYTPAELAKVESQRLQWRGANVYLWTLPRHTFCFVDGQWSYWSSGLNTLHAEPWAYYHATMFNGSTYVSGPNGVAVLSDVATDEGDAIDRRMRTFVRTKNDSTFTLDFLTLGISQGLKSADSTVSLSISRDGKLWSNRFYRDAGSLGEYAKLLQWRYPGGLGQYDGYVGLEVSTSSGCEFSFDSAVIGISQ